MKKFLSLALALMMLCSLAVTAFAADTTTLTVTIPQSTNPDYTLHIPADTTLTYGEDSHDIGRAYVTDVAATVNKVEVIAPFTNLINTADSSDYLQWEMDINAYGVHQINGTNLFDGSRFVAYDDAGYHDLNCVARTYALMTWDQATPGATYQATITFTAFAS